MIAQIIKVFFLTPLNQFKKTFFGYSFYLYQFCVNALLCKDVENKSTDDIAREAFKIFKFIIFLIIANLAINDVFFNQSSNVLHEIKSESGYLLFFIITFFICYYVSATYSFLRNNQYLKIIITRNWLLTMIIATIIFQLTGVLNPNGICKIEMEDTITSGLTGIIFSYLIFFIFQFYQILRSKFAKWYDVFFYFGSFSLYIFLLIFKAVVIQMLIA